MVALQTQLDAFRRAYNEQRPHRAIGRVTPGAAYRATPKASAAGSHARGHFRLRYDIADGKGAITLRRAGRLYHLKIGAAFAGAQVGKRQAHKRPIHAQMSAPDFQSSKSAYARSHRADEAGGRRDR